MKTVLIIDHGDRCPEEALKLLRAHGYLVEPAESEAAVANEPGRVRNGVVTGPDPAACPRTPDTARSSSGGTISLQADGADIGDIHASTSPILVARASDGTILDGNQPFSDLAGYTREEVIGQHEQCSFFFLNPELWSESLRKLEAEGEVRDLETRLLSKDGLVKFVSATLRIVEINGMRCHVISLRDRSVDDVGRWMAGAPVLPDSDLESLLSEDRDFNREDVGRLIDFRALQDLMNSFYKITRIGIGINDVKGNVHVATGWQDVCTRFHRIHPETLKNCLESDIRLSRLLRQGEALYKCRNGMWDLAIPLVIGGRHIANIFLGQFFFEDEVPDYDFFRKQAEIYGFDTEAYLAAVDGVPRWSRELVADVMEFYKKLAVMISRLSIGTIQLTKALSQQRQNSEELRQASLVVEKSPVVLFRWRAEEGWPVELVSANVTRFGYTKEELLTGAVPFSALVHPDDLDRVALEVGGYTVEGVDNFQQEYRIVTKDGMTRWIDDRTVIERDIEGKVTHYQGIVIDITERRRVEEALRESEDWLRSIFLVAPIGIGVVRDRILLTVNSRICEMTGYTREELVGENAVMLYPDQEEFERVGRDKYRQIREKGTGTIETRWRKKDGSLIDILLASTPMHPSDLSKGVTFTALDITERKHAEEKLRQSEAKFFSAFHTSPDSVNINRLEDGLFLDVNEGFSTITGYQPEEVIGRTWQELGIWLNREDRERLVREINRCGYVTDLEAEFRRKDGSILTGQMSARVIEIEGEPCIVNIVRDVTEKRRVEELMRASLEEKTVLLQEIHHRVKNNLQIISSLLELQSGFIVDENFRRYVLDSQNRIMAMGLVHEKLYQSECFAAIDFGDYIDDLAHALFAGYVKDSQLVQIMVDAGDFLLGIDEAIPCGLIVNELVSNSLKHAFPSGRRGHITVQSHAGADGRITLKVADTGIGLPPGLDFGTTETLGLQLVAMLVKQLKGTVEMNSGQSGTVFVITFPGALLQKVGGPGRHDEGSHSSGDGNRVLR